MSVVRVSTQAEVQQLKAKVAELEPLEQLAEDAAAALQQDAAANERVATLEANSIVPVFILVLSLRRCQRCRRRELTSGSSLLLPAGLINTCNLQCQLQKR